MERRDFLKQSAALASVTALGGVPSAHAKVPTLNIRRLDDAVVLVDERFSDSRRFAAALASRGVRVVSLSEDIGRLWYGDLRTHCARSGSFISGLTLHTDLFVSQLFARDCGKALQTVGEHDCRGRTTLVHSLPAGIDLTRIDRWPEAVAAAMCDKTVCDAAHVVRSSLTRRADDHPGSLFSWMIV